MKEVDDGPLCQNCAKMLRALSTNEHLHPFCTISLWQSAAIMAKALDSSVKLCHNNLRLVFACLARQFPGNKVIILVFKMKPMTGLLNFVCNIAIQAINIILQRM